MNLLIDNWIIYGKTMAYVIFKASYLNTDFVLLPPEKIETSGGGLGRYFLYICTFYYYEQT